MCMCWGVEALLGIALHYGKAKLWATLKKKKRNPQTSPDMRGSYKLYTGTPGWGFFRALRGSFFLNTNKCSIKGDAAGFLAAPPMC